MAEAMDPEARATSLADVTLKDISTRYTLKNELGSGAQATVYLGQSKGSGSSKVAIKVLPLAELEDDEVYEALRMECTLAKQLRHPYIVQMVEVCRDKENVYVVMECLGGGELFEHLLAKGPFKEDYALTIFAQVALAVDYMHSVDIVHRDLKAENLVFAAKGSPVVKFIDFGGASTCGEGGLTGLVGTPQYVAPEVVKGFGDDSPTEIPYGKGCDLWSMGVLLYVMLSKTMPFRAKDIDKLLRQVVKGKFTFTPEDRWRPVSAEARDLITKLLCVDPAKRLTIADVKAHPWCAAAVAKCMATMPKVKAAPAPPKSAGGAGGLLKGLGLGRGTSGTSIVPKVSKGKGKKSPFGVGYVSKEAQYWYDIGDPTDVKQTAGAKLNADGTFNMDNVPEEMKAILADIEAKKAKAAGGGGRVSVQVPAGAAGAAHRDERDEAPRLGGDGHDAAHQREGRGDLKAAAGARCARHRAHDRRPSGLV
jgi:serine/threonine protein kinase